MSALAFVLLVTLEDGSKVAYGPINRNRIDHWTERAEDEWPTECAAEGVPLYAVGTLRQDLEAM